MGFALFNVVVKIKLLGSNEMISLESTTIVIWKTICCITIGSDKNHMKFSMNFKLLGLASG